MSDRFNGASARRYFWNPKDFSRKNYNSRTNLGDPRSHDLYVRGWLERLAVQYSYFPMTARPPFDSLYNAHAIEGQFPSGSAPPAAPNFIGISSTRFMAGASDPFGGNEAIVFAQPSFYGANLGWSRSGRPTASSAVMGCFFRLGFPQTGLGEVHKILEVFTSTGDSFAISVQNNSPYFELIATNGSAVTTDIASNLDFGWAYVVVALIYNPDNSTYDLRWFISGLSSVWSEKANSPTYPPATSPDWLDTNPATIRGVIGATAPGLVISKPFFALCAGGTGGTGTALFDALARPGQYGFNFLLGGIFG